MSNLETQFETHEHDVIVIGAGGAGLRAAIAAAQAGMRTAVICKSLLGKAHTVMAEGGVAASLGNVDPEDGWKTHFSDTMKGGKGINNWRMAEIFAKEAPDRVLELERWGAIFDRTPAGLINQRPFGAHTYRRLCHIGDRTGLELIRSLQDKGIHSGMDVFMEYTMTRLIKDADGRVSGAFGYRREDGRFVVFKAKAVVMATGGWGKMFKVTSNSWESTGDGLAMAFEAGAELVDMEFVQFHPTGMIWPPGARGILVTEAVRGEGGRLKNSEGRRFMEDYDPDRMELSSRDVVARSIYKEVQAGRGSEHGGAYLDITHRGADYIKKKLPSMHEQFLKLADVEITKEPMEVAPTIHYVMGGIRVDPETAAASIPGLFAAGEVAGGLHGANRLGGNSLSDILVFGKRAGDGAAAFARDRGEVGGLDEAEIEAEKALVLRPFDNFEAGKRENPFTFMAQVQEVMGEHNGIARTGEGLEAGLGKWLELKARVDELAVADSRIYNPGWHAARDQRFMIEIGEAMLRCGIERTESRGSHWRLDHLDLDPEWGKLNLVVTLHDGDVKVERRPTETMPAELAGLIDDKPAVSQAALQATRQ
ncbi:MAG: succinate dehydrogenase / fumarate reductase, flavoprotein subunit [Chloroflexota bacterium]|jgi:succinate dehydrogenase / fumarate reductase flavoprotein subunit|nr:succinate dehydrogenase / fumarate reductase, flavoprotein subunit [Chloroflexota bacterium]